MRQRHDARGVGAGLRAEQALHLAAVGTKHRDGLLVLDAATEHPVDDRAHGRHVGVGMQQRRERHALERLSIDAQRVDEAAIRVEDAPVLVQQEHHDGHVVGELAQPALGRDDAARLELLLRDVGQVDVERAVLARIGASAREHDDVARETVDRLDDVTILVFDGRIVGQFAHEAR